MPESNEPQLDELRRRARRRLVGAVVLALAAAVLVPMLLESDPKPLGEDVSVKIPPVDDAKFTSKLPARAETAPVVPAKPAGPPPAEPPKESVAAAPAKETPAAEAQKPAPPQKPAPNDPAKSPPVKPGTFSVQLAAFADDKGANALANRLKKAGHPAYTEPYSTSRGTLWRVRVGPYSTREAAESARTKLKADGQNGIIATVP